MTCRTGAAKDKEGHPLKRRCNFSVSNARIDIRESGVRRQGWIAGEAPALLVAALASGLLEAGTP